MEYQIDELRKKSSQWTLGDDNALCTLLENLRNSMVARVEQLDARIEGITRMASGLDANVDNINYSISVLASTQFIEQRVAEEQPAKVMSMETPSKTLEARQAEILANIHHAVTDGLNLLSSDFRKVQLRAVDLGLPPESHFQPEDQYLANEIYASTLPVLIGSSEFYTSSLPPKPAQQPPPSFIETTIPFNDSSLLPCTSGENDERLLATNGPSTSTPVDKLFPVPSFNDDQIAEKPSTDTTSSSVIPPVPNMDGFRSLLPKARETMVAHRESISPVIPNNNGVTVDNNKRSILFDDSDGESDEDDIFAQAKRSVPVRKAAQFDTISKKSSISANSNETRHSSVPVSDSGRGSPVHHIENGTVDKAPVAVPRSIVPSLEDVISGSQKLRSSANNSVQLPKPNVSNGHSNASVPIPKERSPVVASSLQDPVPPRIFQENTAEEPTKSGEKSLSSTAVIKKSIFDSDSDSDSDLFSISRKSSQPAKKEIITNGGHPKLLEIPSRDTTVPQLSGKVETKPSVIAPTVITTKITVLEPKKKGLFDSDSDGDDLFTAIKKPSVVGPDSAVLSKKEAVHTVTHLITRKAESSSSVVEVPQRVETSPVSTTVPSSLSDKPQGTVGQVPDTVANKTTVPKLQTTVANKTTVSQTEPFVSIPEQDEDNASEQDISSEGVVSVPSEAPQLSNSSVASGKVSSGPRNSSPIGFDEPPELPRGLHDFSPQETAKDSPVEPSVSQSQTVDNIESSCGLWDQPPLFPVDLSDPSRQSSPSDKEDSDSEMSVRGKLANSAFASKLNATLAKPPTPGGVRLIPGPPVSDSVTSSESAKTESARSSSIPTVPRPPQQPPTLTRVSTSDQSTKLFEDRPNLLSCATKSRTKGPARRPPSKNILKDSTDEKTSRAAATVPTQPISRRSSSSSSNIVSRPPSPASSVSSEVKQSERKSSITRQLSSPTVGDTSATVQRKQSLTRVSMSPPLVRKESTGTIGRKISITSQEVKSGSVRPSISTTKKSIFDSESSDEDLFKKKATVVVKKASVPSSVNKETTKPPAPKQATVTTTVVPSSSTKASISTVKAVTKKTLFDDSDEDLDLFRKK